MTAAAIGQSFDAGLAQLDVRTDTDRTARRSDAQLGIRELEVLRRDLDMVAPPEAAELAEPLVDLYRGTPTSGDHLRLPQLTSHDATSLRAAVSRVLSADTRAHAGNQDAILKEARMRRVLTAIDSAVADIRQRAAMNMKD